MFLMAQIALTEKYPLNMIWKILTPQTSKSVQEDFLLTVPTLTVTAKDPLLLRGGSGVALILG